MALIEAPQLKKLIDDQQDFLLFDCRFDLVDSEAGYKSYLEGHIQAPFTFTQTKI